VSAPTDDRARITLAVDAAVSRREPYTTTRAPLRSAAGSLLVVLLPCAVTTAITAVDISVPSYWRDEAATMAAVQRPFGALVSMLGNVDAVHGTYYMLMWPLASLFGTGELVMRVPSLLAMALTAGLIAATGRRLFSPAAGLAAGLVFAILPNVTLYGQMARSYAMVTLAAAVASYLLVRLAADHTSRPDWIWYAVSLTMLGALNIFGLLLVPAHGITVMARFRRADGSVSRASLVRWLAAVSVAVALNLPLISLAYQQRVQINWMSWPNLQSVGNALDLLGPPYMSVAILTTILAGAAASLASRRRARERALATSTAVASTRLGAARAAGHGWKPILALGLPWLLLPAPVLLLVSLFTPVYTSRYIMFCLPAGALIAGPALASLARMPGPRLLGWTASAAAFAVIAALGFSTQVQERQPAGHADDIRAADKIVAANARPGDEVYYPFPVFMSVSSAYPYGLGQLPDIQVGVPAIGSGTLAGTTVPRFELVERLALVSRVWVVDVNGDKNVARLMRPAGLHLVRTWQASDLWLQLWVRNPPGWSYRHYH